MMPPETETLRRTQENASVVEAEREPVLLEHPVFPLEPVRAGLIEIRQAERRITALSIVGDRVADGVGSTESRGLRDACGPGVLSGGRLRVSRRTRGEHRYSAKLQCSLQRTPHGDYRIFL
jgi:hypothetical protein